MVGAISKYMQSTRKQDLEAAKLILKYVNFTLDLGLPYKRGTKFVLYGFTEADFGGELNDRRSTLGYVFFCGSTGVSWCSKKQDKIFFYY